MSYGSPASTYGAAPQYGAAGLPAQGGGGGVPPGSVRLDEPAPGNVMSRYAGAGMAAKGIKTYVTQEIGKVSEGGTQLKRMLVVNSHFVMQLTTDGSTPVVKRLLPLVDIEAINVDVADSKIHFKVKPQAKIRDWLFFLQNRGSHSKFGEVLTTIDKLRMLCMAEPRSLQPWGTINPAQVQTQKRPGSIEPKQLILAYKNGSLKMPLRKHRPGSIYPPITQEQQQLQPQEHFPPPPVRQAEASPPPTNPQDDHTFRKLDGKVRQYIIRLDHPGQDGQYVYSARLPHEGIRILEIVPNGPFHKAGAPCGHLTSIEGRPISTETDVMQEMQRLRSEGQTEYVIEMIADPDITPLPPYRPPVPVDNDDNFETDSQQDTEEYLAEKLHEVATMRRKGAIPEGDYQEIRGKIIRLLNKDGKSIPDESSFAPSPTSGPRTRPAPFPWGEINCERYIYLRERPERGCNWMGAAHGLVQTIHIVDPDWVFCRLDSGEEGYVRERYVSYLPSGPDGGATTKRRGRTQRGGLDSLFGAQIADLLSPGRAGGGGQAEPSVASRSSWGLPVQGRDGLWYDPDAASDVRTDELAWLTL